MSKVVITRRHTGRFAITMDAEAFEELALRVLGWPAEYMWVHPDRAAAAERILSAFQNCPRALESKRRQSARVADVNAERRAAYANPS